jgi:glycosyltransferase involved in cell wall biosynthesis
MSALPPRVSVVMPVYNAERHLAAAIRSVLASDLAELELIVLDDGSRDGSLAVARGIEDPRLTVVALTASGGPSRPRNVGISQARAPYVALLDADDLMKPDKLSLAFAALDAHPGAGIAFTDYERMDEDGRLFEESTLSGYPMFAQLTGNTVAGGWHLIRQQDFALGLLHENFIGTSGVVLRKSVLDRVGAFDEGLTYSEDRDLWFRIAHASDALYLPRIGHAYRVAPGSLSFRPGDQQARSRIVVLEREKQRWRSSGPRREIDRRIAENLAAIGYEHRRCGRRLAAFTTFLRAMTASPQLRWLRGAAGSFGPSLHRR